MLQARSLSVHHRTSRSPTSEKVSLCSVHSLSPCVPSPTSLCPLMLTKIQVKGVILNQAYFVCPSCDTHHYIFGKPDQFHKTMAELAITTLGELPILSSVSESGDRGAPVLLRAMTKREEDKEADGEGKGLKIWKDTFAKASEAIWSYGGVL